MSDFSCPVVEIKTIEKHPNADKLEIVKIGGYNVISQIGQFSTGQTVIYIPENAIVPDNLLEEMNLTRRLSGKEKNRVKAIKLRGILSEGLIYPNFSHKPVGTDCKEKLGIIKYEPPIPTQLSGKVKPGLTYKGFDVENIKKDPTVLSHKSYVRITEKLHGTYCQIGFHPNGTRTITSKGLANKGLVFADDSSIYTKVVNELPDLGYCMNTESFYFFGEIVGPRIQKMTYDLSRPTFYLFACWAKSIGFWNSDAIAQAYKINHVPILYTGYYDSEYCEKLAQEPSELNGGLREGIVVTDMWDLSVRAKFINPKYLLSKNSEGAIQ